METIIPIPSGYSGNNHSSEDNVLSIYSVSGIVLDIKDSEVPPCLGLGSEVCFSGLAYEMANKWPLPARAPGE